MKHVLSASMSSEMRWNPASICKEPQSIDISGCSHFYLRDVLSWIGLPFHPSASSAAQKSTGIGMTAVAEDHFNAVDVVADVGYDFCERSLLELESSVAERSASASSYRSYNSNLYN